MTAIKVEPQIHEHDNFCSGAFPAYRNGERRVVLWVQRVGADGTPEDIHEYYCEPKTAGRLIQQLADSMLPAAEPGGEE